MGKVLVARSVKGVCAILIGDDADELTMDLTRRFPQVVLVQSEAAVKANVAKILRYIAKPSDGLHLTLDMRGTPFQRRVWEKLKAISAGRTVSYMAVPASTGGSALFWRYPDEARRSLRFMLPNLRFPTSRSMTCWP